MPRRRKTTGAVKTAVHFSESDQDNIKVLRERNDETSNRAVISKSLKVARYLSDLIANGAKLEIVQDGTRQELVVVGL